MFTKILFTDDWVYTDRSNEETSDILDLMGAQLEPPPPLASTTFSTSASMRSKLAKHSDETSSYGIPSGSNTPQVADTCDPRISQGLEILQRYEVTDCNIVFILGPTTYYL